MQDVNVFEQELIDEEWDREVGTAVTLLDYREDFEAAELLLTSSPRLGEWINNDWNVDYYALQVHVEIAFIDSFTDDVCERIVKAFNDVKRGTSDGISNIVIVPKRVTGDWRAARREALMSGVNNQAARLPVADHLPRKYGLRFRSAEELRVFNVFEEKQAGLPPEMTISVAPNAVLLVVGKPMEVDLLVTHHGRVGIVEVDGPHHAKRYAADASRDALLRDAGVSLIERIVVEDTTDAKELRAFVERFLQRLMSR